MYLNETIKEKFINESADILIDSLNEYSDYINENLDLQYYTELTYQHLIGYYKCEKFLTEDGRFSGFSIVGDYVLDFKDVIGESPNDINSEYVYSFYLDTYMSRLVFFIEEELNNEYFNENGFIENKFISLIEKWRANELESVRNPL